MRLTDNTCIKIGKLPGTAVYLYTHDPRLAVHLKEVVSMLLQHQKLHLSYTPDIKAKVQLLEDGE